jgi:uncharacterized protein YbaA (DUF1428 family)
MAYVDGFVIPIPKKNVKAYLKMAREGFRLWRRHGALDYKECVADDLEPMGMPAVFPKLARLKPGETLVFAYIVYKNRKHRDSVNKKVMQEMATHGGPPKNMPFDMKRVACGGFKVIVG